MSNLLTIKEASEWASEYLEKEVTTSNISYLLNYGRVPKAAENGDTLIKEKDLLNYYKDHDIKKQERWKEKLGEDLNWTLSFSEYKESETTKHVHRLHPYKGKYIPQLVEYFLDDHTDDFKTEVFFSTGDIVLDPFCGSGTTLVQANELGLHAIGIDVSAFNSLIGNSKVAIYDLVALKKECDRITRVLKKFISERNNIEFENELLTELKKFNDKYFPSPEFKKRARSGEINDKIYGKEKANKFAPIFDGLIDKFNLEIHQESSSDSFLDKWYLKTVRDEIDVVFEEIKQVEAGRLKKILSIILSRTIRSCRATTHSDLATLNEPTTAPYYCRKHGKICKPLFSILSWWERYSKDTLKRLAQFDQLRTNTYQICLTGDSREIDVFTEVKNRANEFYEILDSKKIKGIMSSPPYLGLINYHEQHEYSYDLFGFDWNQDLEIGPLYKGKGKEAKESYKKGISDVLNNTKKFLQEDYDIFLVANDKHNLYPEIAKLAGMKIVNQYKRPVLNRVEKDRNPYSEIIFHFKPA
ncbi:MAG TPA: restriction endonuclease subunit M [Balneola sp.]|jgi:hypothetical protein|nr:restriction endonuclease subunit M [Balneola sp.]MAO78611.1 restriction endonuclease subunit M [Balneola sp.]MBF63160.1 restriction endonuclease subunit M [Balneola sp.]HAH51254.1 restriction endonuclease subunit M [Balneola sp.]HBZ38403.1 restriction endonuclease subunit M [Balneola sp.]|tara:strand:+ start:14098 stop:15678 length:1581 start_codon:yes stop_codon:yes gene_type:complete